MDYHFHELALGQVFMDKTGAIMVKEGERHYNVLADRFGHEVRSTKLGTDRPITGYRIPVEIERYTPMPIHLVYDL